MKILLVISCLWIASLVILQSPNNKGTAKQNSASGAHPSNEPSQKQTNSSNPAPNGIVVNCNQGSESGCHTQEKSQTNEDMEIQRKLADFTKYLVWVGGVQAAILAGTLLLICWQARLMKTHAEHLKCLASAAGANAVAAKKSAEALISSERAWVTVDIEWQAGSHIFGGDDPESGPITGIYVNYTCRNFGKSFAQITDRGYVFRRFADVSEIPDKPDFGGVAWIEFTNEYLPPSAASEPAPLSGVTCPGKLFSTGMMVFYGRVDYRDVYGEHATSFGYFITPQGVMVRLPVSTYPEYNKHT